MKITRINKIKNYRIFRDFTWPTGLSIFSQFNVFYGWNASGKTTLSSLFRCLQDRRPVTEGEIELEVDETTKINAGNISGEILPQIRVFNSDFIAETIKSIDVGQIAPIYFLGAESIEKQKQVESLKNELKSATEKVLECKQNRKQAEKAQDDFSIAAAKLIKTALPGAVEYINYDKRQYNQAIQNLKQKAVLPNPLSIEEKRRLQQQKEVQAKPSISFISIQNVPNLTDLCKETDSLLQRSIASQILDELVADPKIGIWVQNGLDLHSGDHQTDTCRFCGNNLSSQRRVSLEAHFNDAFSLFQDELECAIKNIKGYKNILSSLTLPDDSRFYSHIAEEAHNIAVNIQNLIENKIQALNKLEEALHKKKDAPFMNIKLNESDFLSNPTCDNLKKAIDVMNSMIEKHQDTTLNLNSEIQNACKLLEQDLLLDSLPKFRDLEKANTESHDFLTTAQTAEQCFHSKINELEREIIEHRRPAEELNGELIAYLGRIELRFEIKETGYALTRNGHPAMHLSEGERTAIAFLYFLKSLEDKSFDIKSGIVVIDDPVSSLDSNALFSAFAYMKERTKNAGQLFIFTHNFGFFRQIKNWFHHLKGQRKQDISKRPARFYHLVNETHGTKSSSKITTIDPLIEEFESEYHFLFKLVFELANNKQAATSLTQFYSIPNVARRLIETFLAYRYPDCSGDLIKRFDLVDFDVEKKTRILRLLNTYSHSGTISDPEHDPSILAETKPVLLDLLELMKTLDPYHIAGMERLVSPYMEDLSPEASKPPSVKIETQMQTPKSMLQETES